MERTCGSLSFGVKLELQALDMHEVSKETALRALIDLTLANSGQFESVCE
jgi:hypothetical protein